MSLRRQLATSLVRLELCGGATMSALPGQEMPTEPEPDGKHDDPTAARAQHPGERCTEWSPARLPPPNHQVGCNHEGRQRREAGRDRGTRGHRVTSHTPNPIQSTYPPTRPGYVLRAG